MDSANETMTAAFHFLCYENTNICRLCLRATDIKFVAMDELIYLNRHYFDEALTLLDMFLDLGIPNDDVLPQVLCNDCANITINSYLFKHLVHYSKELWKNTMEKIEKGLTELKMIRSASISAYLILNKEKNMLISIRNPMKVMNKKNVCNRLNNVLKSRANYIQSKKVQAKSKTNNTENSPSSPQTRYPCSSCSKTYKSQVILKDHIERVHLPKKIQCTSCSKFFSTKRILQNHVRLHHEAAQCKLCSKEFPSKYLLNIHVDKHEAITCSKCNKTYANKPTFKMHQKICLTSENREPTFFCDLCNKGYLRKNGLRSHIKTDHGFGNVYTCQWCNKKFDAISRLNYHTVKHTRERNFRCDVCANKFVTQAALVYHQRLHTGEKPFPCDLCSESFLSASRRMEHKHRKHFGPSKECPICHIKFISGFQLRKHIERHSNPQSKLYVMGMIKAEV